MKEKYEKPKFEIVDLLYEVFTNDSQDDPEHGHIGFDDEEDENLLTSLLNMAKQLNIVKDIFGFDTNEDGSLVDKDGNVYNYDEFGNIVDAEGKIVVTAEQLQEQESETEGEDTEDQTIEGDDFEGQIVEGENNPEGTPTETDLGELENLGDEIDDVFGGGGAGETTVPDDTPTETEGTVTDAPVAEEPIVESPVVEEPIIETPSEPDITSGFTEE